MTKVERRAPENGYDNDTKSKYRHNVWKHLSHKAIPILENNHNAKILMMPSKEGLEIDVAIKFGINPEQIIAIDENPALLAHAKWKSKIPKENRFGCKVSKIGKKIQEKGWVIAAANLDFCNNFSDELMEEVQSFIDSDCLIETFYLAITLMKGRETKALLKLIRKIGVNELFDEPRLTTLFEVVDWGNAKINPIYEDSYYNSSPIIYGIAEIDRDNKVLLNDNNIRSIENNLGKDFRYYVDSDNRDLGAIIFRDGYKHQECYSHLHNGWWVFNEDIPEYFEPSGIDIMETPNCLLPIKYFSRHEAIRYINAIKKMNKRFEYNGEYHRQSIISVEHNERPYEGRYQNCGNNYVVRWNSIIKDFRYYPGNKKRTTIKRFNTPITKNKFFNFIEIIEKNNKKEALGSIRREIEKIESWNSGYPLDAFVKDNFI